MSSTPQFLNAAEAARFLGVKPQRVRQWWERGELKASNLGDGIRVMLKISMADIQAFLDRRAQPPAKPPTVSRRRRKAEAALPDRY